MNEDIYLGAKNRIKNLKIVAKEKGLSADLYMSIESGINNLLGQWVITNVALIEDNDGYESFATSPSFPVPDILVEEIIKTDLHQVMNKLFSEDEDRRNNGGGIQLLTHGKVSRIDITEIAFVMALTKFINGNSWK